jgi:hypothetical protein
LGKGKASPESYALAATGSQLTTQAALRKEGKATQPGPCQEAELCCRDKKKRHVELVEASLPQN